MAPFSGIGGADCIMIILMADARDGSLPATKVERVKGTSLT